MKSENRKYQKLGKSYNEKNGSQRMKNEIHKIETDNKKTKINETKNVKGIRKEK